MAEIDGFITSCQRGAVDLIEALGDEWRGLAGESGDDQPFYHPEFIAPYVRFFTDGDVWLLTARRNGALKAVLPLVRERVWILGIPAIRLRAPANALRFDMTKADGAEGDAAVRAIWQELKNMQGYDFIELRDVIAPSGGRQLADAALAAGSNVGEWVSKEVPYLPLEGGGERPWLKLAKKSLIETVKQGNKRIARELGASAVLVRNYGFSSDLVKRFYDIESAGWKGKNGTAVASRPNNLAFYDQICAAGGQHGYFCTDSLLCVDCLIAIAISFVYRKKYYVLKWAYAEEFSPYSPGHLLINAILERCVAEGYEELDFMGEKADYMLRWTSMTRTHSFFYIFGKTFPGTLIHFVKFRLSPFFHRWKTNIVHRLRSANPRAAQKPAP